MYIWCVPKHMSRSVKEGRYYLSFYFVYLYKLYSLISRSSTFSFNPMYFFCKHECSLSYSAIHCLQYIQMCDKYLLCASTCKCEARIATILSSPLPPILDWLDSPTIVASRAHQARCCACNITSQVMHVNWSSKGQLKLSVLFQRVHVGTLLRSSPEIFI